MVIYFQGRNGIEEELGGGKLFTTWWPENREREKGGARDKNAFF